MNRKLSSLEQAVYNCNANGVINKNKSSTRAPPDYEERFPPGMRAFVQEWLKTGVREAIEKEHHRGGKYFREGQYMFVHYLIRLGNAFLNQEFQQPCEFRRVKDAPDPELALSCLGCALGLSPHNGTIFYAYLLRLYRDSFDL